MTGATIGVYWNGTAPNVEKANSMGQKALTVSGESILGEMIKPKGEPMTHRVHCFRPRGLSRSST